MLSSILCIKKEPAELQILLVLFHIFYLHRYFIIFVFQLQLFRQIYHENVNYSEASYREFSPLMLKLMLQTPECKASGHLDQAPVFLLRHTPRMLLYKNVACIFFSFHPLFDMLYTLYVYS